MDVSLAEQFEIRTFSGKAASPLDIRHVSVGETDTERGERSTGSRYPFTVTGHPFAP